MPAPCTQCQSEYTYEDGHLIVCPECGHEQARDAGPAAADAGPDSGAGVRDAHGTPLSDGDTVTVVKDLKVKGSSAVVKVGTKVRNIRLVDGDHDIDCRIEGIGAMKLKSMFVRKA